MSEPAPSATTATVPTGAQRAPSWPTRARASLVEMATADPRTLGLFRLLLGAYLLVDWYRRLPDYVLFMTNEGMLPAHASVSRPMGPFVFSVFHAAHSRGEVVAFLVITLLVYLAFFVGYRTRLAHIAALVLTSSLHSRNIMLENGGDVVANLLVFWTCFLPLGQRFSVDALRASFEARKEKRPDELNDGKTPPGTTTPTVSLAYAAAILNCACIYYFNVVHKDGIPWNTRTTVHFVLWSDRLIQPLGILLREVIPPVGVFGLTVGTLVIEASITTLLLSPVLVRPCRRVAALLIIALHVGLQTVGHFGMFAFAMMLHAPLFLGPEDWEALARRWQPRLSRRVVVYDADCGVCFLAARFLRRLDPDGRLRFVPNDDPDAFPASVDPSRVEHTMIVTDEAGTQAWEEEAAIAQIARCLPYGVLAARLIELPGLRPLVRLAYRTFALRRKRVSAALGYGACGVPLRLSGSDRRAGTGEPIFFRHRFSTVAREVLVAVMVLAVGAQVMQENRKAPAWLKPKEPSRVLLGLAQYPRLMQGWSMFAPVPPLDEGTIVVDAVTVDGRHIDPLRSGGPVDFSMPDIHHGLLVSQFWYEFADRIRREGNARFREYFRNWILDSHRIDGRGDRDRIVSFEAFWVSRPTQPPFQKVRRPTNKARFMSYPETDPKGSKAGATGAKKGPPGRPQPNQNEPSGPPTSASAQPPEKPGAREPEEPRAPD